MNPRITDLQSVDPRPPNGLPIRAEDSACASGNAAAPTAVARILRADAAASESVRERTPGPDGSSMPALPPTLLAGFRRIRERGVDLAEVAAGADVAHNAGTRALQELAADARAGGGGVAHDSQGGES